MANYKGNYNTRGATLAEFSLVVPLFLASILGLLYLGFNLTVQGVLDHAANRALAVAVSAPELSEPHVTCVANSNSPYCLGLDKIKQAALDIINSSAMIKQGSSYGLANITISSSNPNISIPQPAATETIQQAFEKTPITIQITAQVNSFIPLLGSITYIGRAAGYYEVRTAVSYPIDVDCNGNPKNSPAYKTVPCNCSSIPNAIFNPVTWSCEVCGGVRSNVQDHLPNGTWAHYYQIDLNATACYCPTDEFCQATFGAGAITTWANSNINDKCKCGCDHSSDGWQSGILGQNGLAECACTWETWRSHDYTGPGGTHHFNGKVIQINGAGYADDHCVCDPPLTNEICQQLFPDEQVGISGSSKCNCWCTNTCINSHLNSLGNWENGPPTSNWNPSLGCNCGCSDVTWTYGTMPNRQYTEGVGCTCSNSCSTLPGGRPRVPNSSDPNCACACADTPLSCQPYEYYDTELCNCKCYHTLADGSCDQSVTG